MKISFYFDEMMPRAAADQLNKNGYDVVLANDVGMTKKDDLTEHLPYATSQNRILVTHDREFAGRASKRDDHAGLICWTGSLSDIGGIVQRLSQFADSKDDDTAKGLVFWIK